MQYTSPLSPQGFIEAATGNPQLLGDDAGTAAPIYYLDLTGDMCGEPVTALYSCRLLGTE